MAMKVLLADHDLDVHKLIADILPILFRNVTIDRVMKSEGVLEKLGSPEANYGLVIVDLQLGDVDGQSIVTAIQARFPEVLERLVLIVDSPDAVPKDTVFNEIPHVTKPFSLDEFGEIVRKKARID